MTLEGRSECIDVQGFAHVGVDGAEADRQLRRTARARAGLDVEEARWLLVARRAEVHREHGCATFLEYVERILGYGPRAASERLRVAEALVSLPRTREALAGGELSYSAVREITRIVEPETEGAWIDAVRGRTAREVETMVAGRQVGDRPEDPSQPDLRTRAVRLELSPESYALWCEAEKRIGARDDSELAMAMSRAVLAEEDAPGRTPGPAHQIATTVCAECRRGWQDAGGQVIEVGAAAIERAGCDAEELGRVDVDEPAPATTTIPQAIRTRVFRRDHRRCVVPGCRSTRYLEVHHVVFRADGGGHELSNLAVVCAGHHDAVHQGRLTIRGDANRGLTFEPALPTGANDTAALVRDALRGLQFKAYEAEQAVERAVARVGSGVSLEVMLRAALQECPRPRTG